MAVDGMVAADSQSKSAWLGLRVGVHPALSLHSSNEPGEPSQWLRAMNTAP